MNILDVKKASSLRLDRELYNYIEKLAKKENRSVNNYIETVLANARRFYEPNVETKKAIEEARQEGANLKGYTDMDELLADLEK